MIVTIAVMGIMSAIMLQVFSNVRKNARKAIATEMNEAVNLGLKKFVQGNYKITIAADDNKSDDEVAILALLQERDPLIPGTPFVRPDWKPVPSDDVESFRIRWAGQMFALLEPGEAGHGLRVNFQAEDY